MDDGKTVGFVLYDDCTLLDFVGATQIFATWASGWNPVWIAPDIAPIRTSEGLDVLPNHTFASHPELDVVFVPGGGGAGVAAVMRDQRYLDWLRTVAATNDPWVGCVCVGTFILAAAGLLTGATVTTHWRLLDELRKLAPTYDMTVPSDSPDPEARRSRRALVDHERKRFSGGGVSSSIDLASTLVRDLNDADVAMTAALLVQYAPHLPEDVLPGSPDTTDPVVLEQVTNNPSLVKNFVEPIAQAVKELEAPR